MVWACEQKGRKLIGRRMMENGDALLQPLGGKAKKKKKKNNNNNNNPNDSPSWSIRDALCNMPVALAHKWEISKKVSICRINCKSTFVQFHAPPYPSSMALLLE